MRKLIVEPRLYKRLKAFAEQLQVKFGYPLEIAWKATFKNELENGNIVNANGVVREIRPTAADGRGV